MIDILNRNQRRSAVWRVAALLGIIAALLFTVLTSMHQSYKHQGSGELEALKKSMSDQKNKSDARINGLVQDTVRLSLQLKNLKNNDTAQDSMLEIEDDLKTCKEYLKLEEKEVRKLNKEVSKLEFDLDLCRSN